MEISGEKDRENWPIKFELGVNPHKDNSRANWPESRLMKQIDKSSV